MFLCISTNNGSLFTANTPCSFKQLCQCNISKFLCVVCCKKMNFGFNPSIECRSVNFFKCGFVDGSTWHWKGSDIWSKSQTIGIPVYWLCDCVGLLIITSSTSVGFCRDFGAVLSTARVWVIDIFSVSSAAKYRLIEVISRPYTLFKLS